MSHPLIVLLPALLLAVGLVWVSSAHAAQSNPLAPFHSKTSTTEGSVERSNADLVAAGGVLQPNGDYSFDDGKVTVSPNAHGASACYSGAVCFYEHTRFNTYPGAHGGRVLRFYQPGYRVNHMGISFGFNDQASSWVNNAPFNTSAAEHTYLNGARYCMASGQTGFTMGGWNDRISSFINRTSTAIC